MTLGIADHLAGCAWKQGKATGISEHLEAVLADLAGEQVTFAQILPRLGNRAHGPAILLFALPRTLQMPYGIPTASGTAILLVSLQLLICPGRTCGCRFSWVPAGSRGPTCSGCWTGPCRWLDASRS